MYARARARTRVCGGGVQSLCALMNGGAYAEYAVAPVGQCLPLPSGLSAVEAACLPETFFTVWHNLFQQCNVFGERLLSRPQPAVLVHGGASGIGTTAIQLCRALGVHVVASAGSAEKRAACERLGAAAAIDYRSASWDDLALAASGREGG
eukprot:COSAG01_NODE_4252_length_5206_cov_4.404151_6_plen_151_part_00